MAERDHLIGLRRSAPGYEQDYAGWLSHQVDLMKASRWSELDHANLIDEVESLGRSDFASFASAIEIVLVHMLKWDVQPAKRTPSWVASIEEHRRRIDQSLQDNPSYKPRIPEAVTRAWRTAPAKAAGEANLRLEDFPAENPYDWAAITTRPHQLPD